MKQHASATNVRRSWIILLLLVLFSATLGFLIGKLFDAGYLGAGLATLAATLYAAICYVLADRLILFSLKARKILRENNVHLYQRIAVLSQQAEILPPELYYIDDSAMNVLSLGKNPNKGKIILTKGLMEKLSAPEIEAALSHELTHIKVQDTRLGALTTLTVCGFPFCAELLRRHGPVFLPFALLLSLFSPPSALLLHLVISPKREFEADAAGALITRYPQGLAQALEKITQDPYSVATAMNATAHLFIVNPFSGKANRSASSLFNTHPPIAQRIKILQSM